MAMSQADWERINRGSKVQRACFRVGHETAKRAQQITDAEGGKAQIRVESSQRPGGRWQVKVISDQPAEEHGTATQPRIRALGRAAREG